MFAQLGMNNPAPVSGGDPLWGNVIYLLPMVDGTLGDTSYTEKVNSEAITFFGAAALSDTVGGPFGEDLAMYLPGNSSLRLGGATTHVAGWDGMFAADAEWTLEFWWYLPAETGLTNNIFCWGNVSPSPDDVVCRILYNSTNNIVQAWTTLSDGSTASTTWDADNFGGIGAHLGTWLHVHVSRVNDDFVIGVNGNNVVNEGVFSSLDIEDPSSAGWNTSPHIHADVQSGGSRLSDDLPMYMAHFRVTVGEDRYGAFATYTVPDGPFPEA